MRTFLMNLFLQGTLSSSSTSDKPGEMWSPEGPRLATARLRLRTGFRFRKQLQVNPIDENLARSEFKLYGRPRAPLLTLNSVLPEMSLCSALATKAVRNSQDV